VFENSVLGRIFGLKRVEVTEVWRKLHNEELHKLYSSPSIIRMIKSRRMRWSGHVAIVMRKEDIGGRTRRKEMLGRLSCTCVDNIKMNLKRYEMGWN
jgi:hypothetical protein